MKLFVLVVSLFFFSVGFVCAQTPSAESVEDDSFMIGELTNRMTTGLFNRAVQFISWLIYRISCGNIRMFNYCW